MANKKKHGVYEIILESHDCATGITTYPKGWRIWINGDNYGFHTDKKEADDRFERLTREPCAPRRLTMAKSKREVQERIDFLRYEIRYGESIIADRSETVRKLRLQLEAANERLEGADDNDN